jgi:riboflavin transporter FmnP
MVYAAVCLALCLALPFLAGQIPEVGNMLAPMHLPVLLAGFLCGPWWGALVGAIAPVYRYFLFGMPPIFPTGFAMCFELAAYGLVSGLLYRVLKGSRAGVYLSLIVSMLAGRALWGAVNAVLYGLGKTSFSFSASFLWS